MFRDEGILTMLWKPPSRTSSFENLMSNAIRIHLPETQDRVFSTSYVLRERYFQERDSVGARKSLEKEKTFLFLFLCSSLPPWFPERRITEALTEEETCEQVGNLAGTSFQPRSAAWQGHVVCKGLVRFFWDASPVHSTEIFVGWDVVLLWF